MNPKDRILNDIQSRTNLNAAELIDDIIDYTFDDRMDIIAMMLKNPGDDAYLGKIVRENYEGARHEIIYEAERMPEITPDPEMISDNRQRAADMRKAS